MTETPSIGHNNPPTEAEIVHEKLVSEHADLTAKANELLAAAAALVAGPPIETDEQMENLLNLIAAIREVEGQLKKRGDDAKAPINRVWDVVHGFFKKPSDDLAKIRKDKLEPARTTFLQAKERRERIARENEAKRLAEEAAERERIAQLEAKWAQNEEDAAAAAESAVQAEVKKVEAEEAKERAAAPAADLARTRTSMGAMGTLVRTLGIRVDHEKIDLEALRQYLSEEAISGAIREYARANKLRIEADLKAGPVCSVLRGVEFYYKTGSRS